MTVDLNVPADAEIVIEGLIDPELLEPEGPFGESHGHVALEDFNMSMRVTAITHKRSPVFVSIISQVTPSESSVLKKVAMEPLFLTHLRDQLAIKGVRRVVLHEPLSNLRKVIFVQYAQGTPRTEVWRGLHGASTLLADCGKICIAVSEDIDPSNYRRGVLVARLSLQPGRGRAHRAASLRRPWAEIRPAPRGIVDPDRRHAQAHRAAARAARARIHGAARARSGRSSACRALTPQPPWHGYSLGDWSESWDVYAQRAVAGQWEQSGAETFARRRGGLIPETPVREVEK